jgi:hypothetical protein
MALLIPESPCEACECCVQYITYSYYDSSEYGDANCNTTTDCTGENCDDPPCCCGASISGTIFSEEYDQKCFDLLTPRAIILGGSLIDNIGSVGEVNFTEVFCDLGFLAEDTEVIPIKVGKRLSLPFSASNTTACGPYGLNSVSVKWYFN